MRIPDWYHEYIDRIRPVLPSADTIKKYCIAHDLGKAFCLTIDENGKRHYPNHEEISEQKWLELAEESDDKALIAKLIRNDMVFHREKPDEIIARKLQPKIAFTLLLSALAAIHANADAFGGRESDSFKIKLKALDKRAKKVLKYYLEHPFVYVIVRGDLPHEQKAVQSCHAVIEATRTFNLTGEHPSVIICSVKNEDKLIQASDYLTQNRVKYCKFSEPDIGNQLTAIATEPLIENRAIFKKFQLLRIQS